MSKEENGNEHLHVSCLIDHLKNGKSKEISEAAEALTISAVMNDGDNAALPMAIQYTHGVGNMAQALAKHDFRSAILFDSPEAFEFTSELLSDGGAALGRLSLIADAIPAEEHAFPMSPDGEGWKHRPGSVHRYRPEPCSCPSILVKVRPTC